MGSGDGREAGCGRRERGGWEWPDDMDVHILLVVLLRCVLAVPPGGAVTPLPQKGKHSLCLEARLGADNAWMAMCAKRRSCLGTLATCCLQDTP